MLTQQQLGRFVQSEAQRSSTLELHREDVARYEARKARAESDSLRQLNSVLGLMAPMLDALVMAAGIGVLAVAIFG